MRIVRDVNSIFKKNIFFWLKIKKQNQYKILIREPPFRTTTEHDIKTDMDIHIVCCNVHVVLYHIHPVYVYPNVDIESSNELKNHI